jgi:hypothetical protein
VSWQDALIAVGNFLMAAALIPSIRSRDEKPPLASSVPTAMFLTSFGVAFLTLGLWLAMAGVWSGAVCWWILAWQRRRVG